MQIPVLSNIPHCKWRPEFLYYNDGSALDNSSEGPKICNYSAVAPDPSIMLSDSPWKGSTFINTSVSDRKLWTLMFCCCCLLWLRETKIGYIRQQNITSYKIPPQWWVKWPLTSTVGSRGVNEHFPKHNQSILQQRKIIPQRNLVSRPLNVSLFCQHKRLAPAVLWKSTMICFHFLLLSVLSPTVIFRCQNSKALKKSGHDWKRILLMTLALISKGINQHVCQKNRFLMSSSPGIKTPVCDWDIFVSQRDQQNIKGGSSWLISS